MHEFEIFYILDHRIYKKSDIDKITIIGYDNNEDIVKRKIPGLIFDFIRWALGS